MAKVNKDLNEYEVTLSHEMNQTFRMRHGIVRIAYGAVTSLINAQISKVNVGKETFEFVRDNVTEETVSGLLDGVLNYNEKFGNGHVAAMSCHMSSALVHSIVQQYTRYSKGQIPMPASIPRGSHRASVGYNVAAIEKVTDKTITIDGITCNLSEPLDFDVSELKGNVYIVALKGKKVQHFIKFSSVPLEKEKKVLGKATVVWAEDGKSCDVTIVDSGEKLYVPEHILNKRARADSIAEKLRELYRAGSSISEEQKREKLSLEIEHRRVKLQLYNAMFYLLRLNGLYLFDPNKKPKFNNKGKGNGHKPKQGSKPIRKPKAQPKAS